jgi:galactose oxidase-like protein
MHFERSEQSMKSTSRRIALMALLAGICGLIACGGGGTSASSTPSQTPSPVPVGTASKFGQWSTLSYTMPINPVHAALLRTGKVLIVSGSGNDPNNAFPINTNPDYEAAVWDPKSGKITTQRVGWDMFCNGMSVMADGRVLINGGTASYGALAAVGGQSDTPFTGLANSSIFDPATESFSVADGPNQGNTAHGRWYPTLTELGDGRMMSTSGLDENGYTNNTSEIYTPGQGWGPEIPGNPSGLYDPSFTFGFPLYPRMHLLPTGQIFYAAPSSATLVFNPSTQSWSFLAWTIYGGPVAERTYGSSVLLPLTPANNYNPKVMIMGGDNPATNTTEIIDLGQPTPTWQQGPPMAQARVEMEATLLPNGKVLISGGSAKDEDATTASLKAEIYDPATNSFSTVAANSFARLYHNTQLLLPDGTVFLAGGNPRQGVYEKTIEIYKPSYLFNADGTPAVRPVISGAPSSINYGSTFTVQTPNADIASVVLIRPGSVTHSFDMDQRFVGLSFTATTSGVTAILPNNSNLAPPGYYMLFLVNKAGVPSIASFVLVTGAPAPVAAMEFRPLKVAPPYQLRRPRHVTESPLPLRKEMHMH